AERRRVDARAGAAGRRGLPLPDQDGALPRADSPGHPARGRGRTAPRGRICERSGLRRGSTRGARTRWRGAVLPSARVPLRAAVGAGAVAERLLGAVPEIAQRGARRRPRSGGGRRPTYGCAKLLIASDSLSYTLNIGRRLVRRSVFLTRSCGLRRRSDAPK